MIDTFVLTFAHHRRNLHRDGSSEASRASPPPRHPRRLAPGRRTQARRAPAGPPRSATGVRRTLPLPRHPEGLAGAALAAERRRRAGCDRELPRGRRAQRVPAPRVLAPGRPPPRDRRSRGAHGARAWDEVAGLMLREGGEPRTRTQGTGAARPLPPARAAHGAGGAQCDPVRVEQCAAAPHQGQTGADAHGAGGPGVVGRLLPRLAAGGSAPVPLRSLHRSRRSTHGGPPEHAAECRIE